AAGRGVGGRVSCPRPLPWRYPTGFAGVCFATVLGLGVWWSVRGLLVVALWPWWVSMARAMCVFEHVRGCGGVCWPSSRSSGLPAGGRLLWCWGGLVECSRVWVEVVAADLVVSRDGEARLACW